jgi:hypothetical protein
MSLAIPLAIAKVVIDVHEAIAIGKKTIEISLSISFA